MGGGSSGQRSASQGLAPHGLKTKPRRHRRAGSESAELLENVTARWNGLLDQGAASEPTRWH